VVRLACIVVTYNSAETLCRCLDSLLEHVVQRNSGALIVVVDNASEDDTCDILRSYAAGTEAILPVFLDKNIGFGSANNVAFERAPADVYLLVNPDAWLVGDSAGPVLEAFDRDSALGIIGLPMEYPNGSPQTYAFARSNWWKWLLQIIGARVLVRRLAAISVMRAFLSKFALGREYVRIHAPIPERRGTMEGGAQSVGTTRSVDWVCGGGMALRGRFVEEIGGFDPAIFLYGEDEDICITARENGWGVSAIETVPLVHHLGWGKNRFNERIADLKYASLQYFIDKHYRGSMEGALMRLLLPLHVYGFWRWVARGLKR